MLISIVIPVYNAAAGLQALLERVRACAGALPYPAEIIMVNDGSRDNSWETMCALRAQHPNFRPVNLDYNTGQQGATLIGMRLAKGDFIYTLDDDLQHPPEAFASMFAALSPETDVVYARAANRFSGRANRLLAQSGKSVLRWLACVPQAQQFSSFRLMRRSMVASFSSIQGNAFSLDGILARSARIGSVRAAFAERAHGVSTYTFLRSLRLLGYMMASYHCRSLSGLAGGKRLPGYAELPA